MQIIENNQSEIARLRRQIEMQLIAMRSGLTGLSAGSARHDFINARMERIGSYQHGLACKVGEDAATMLVYGLYTEIMDAQ
ncbi:MAG TPA: hypothetical protein VKV19_20170 [Ktedonobacteraceae bacterium]|nr:hypothetical protein [Ktedonobacteraceae bacterium]